MFSSIALAMSLSDTTNPATSGTRLTVSNCRLMSSMILILDSPIPAILVFKACDCSAISLSRTESVSRFSKSEIISLCASVNSVTCSRTALKASSPDSTIAALAAVSPSFTNSAVESPTRLMLSRNKRIGSEDLLQHAGGTPNRGFELASLRPAALRLLAY